MSCPTCRKPVDPDSSFTPFCSERCKLVDLANWATEKYVISDPLDPFQENQEENGNDEE